MFKLKNLLLAALMLAQIASFAQKLSDDFEVSAATPYQVIDAGSKEYVSLENGFVIMAKMGRGIVNIQKFDVNGMQEVARNTYDDLPPKAFFQDIIKLEDRVYYIYEAYNKENINYDVYSREINTEDASFKEPVLLFSSSRKVAAPFGTSDLRDVKIGWAALTLGNKFTIHKSFDESKVLIRYRLYPKDKSDARNYDELGFYVFDNTMQKLWGKEVTMPYTEKQMNNLAYSVSSDGNVLMLINRNDIEGSETLIINSDGEISINQLGISSDYKLRKIEIKEDEEGNYICGGFYSNESGFKFLASATSFNANGLLYFEIDKDGEIIKEKNYDFSKEFIQENLSKSQRKAVERREKKGKAGILELFLTDFVIKDDGSAYFVGERQYIRKQGNTNTYLYFFSNMIMIKVDSEGELSWMKKMPKLQFGKKGCGQMSYALMEGEEADYIAYVDNPKNISLSPDDGIPAVHKDGAGGFLTTYKIDHETGNLEKHTILELEKIGKYRAYQFRTTRILKAWDGVFLMEIYIKGKKDTMVKMILN